MKQIEVRAATSEISQTIDNNTKRDDRFLSALLFVA